jgi:hypothetical protein
MEVWLSVAENGNVSDLESLHDWLQQDSAFSGRVSFRAPQPSPTELGTLVDVLTVAVGTGGAVSILASSIKAWLTLPRRSDIRIRIHSQDGTEVDFSADRVDGRHLESILSQALRQRPEMAGE